VVVADAGYWHQAQMEDIVTRGIQVLVPPDANKREGARPGWDGGLCAFMRRVLASDLGDRLYRQRKAMIEPVFGDMKFNRRIDRFQRSWEIRVPLGVATRHRPPICSSSPRITRPPPRLEGAVGRHRAPAAHWSLIHAIPSSRRPMARIPYATATMGSSSRPGSASDLCCQARAAVATRRRRSAPTINGRPTQAPATTFVYSGMAQGSGGALERLGAFDRRGREL
jgi:hypothetical protein